VTGVQTCALPISYVTSLQIKGAKTLTHDFMTEYQMITHFDPESTKRQHTTSDIAMWVEYQRLTHCEPDT